MIDIHEFWQQAVEYLKTFLSEKAINNWVVRARPTRISNNSITLSVPTNTIKDYLQKHVAAYITQFSLEYYGIELIPIFALDIDLPVEIEKTTVPIEYKQSSQRSNLNPAFTFDTFIEGESNSFARATAITVSEDPGTYYNPFLLYGGTGLGKTHLMHSIGNEMLLKNPETRVKFITTEQFTNEFIASIRNSTMAEFKKRYREDIDLLLIDDIQFLSSGEKEKIQEEFFHTFNELLSNGKQVVMTSDRPPHQLKKVEDRLVSRFESGVSAEITVPDLETRIAILQKKVQERQIDINAEAIAYIAKHTNTNVRALEGALLRVHAYSVAQSADITVSLVSQALDSYYDPKEEKQLSIDKIISQVAKYYQITVDDIKGKKRVKTIAMPRQIAMYLSRELTDMSYPKIGEAFDRNHTTVIHAYELIDSRQKTDIKLERDLKDLINRINP